MATYAKKMKKKKTTIITYREKRLALRDKAMPEVKRLVKKYDRAAIQSCLNSLKDYEIKKQQLADAKEEVARLEKEVN